MKILNAFAGIGGNRYYWDDLGNFEITAIELDPKIAEEYSKLFPHNEVIIDDAWSYIESHVEKYDIIWASPPCQTHSHLTLCAKKRRLPDFRLYSLIIFLKKFHKGSWIVENVKPYYEMLIEGNKIGRHIFWSNQKLSNGINHPKMISSNWFGSKKSMKQVMKEIEDYLGFKISKRIYIRNNHDPAQIYRNCVHPVVGKNILQQLLSGSGPELLDYLKSSNDA